MIVFLKKTIAFFIVLLMYCIAFVFFNPFFQSGDDVAMQMIANGMVGGSPEERLVFINVIIGYLLKYLYVNYYIIEWYSLFIIIFNFSSLLIIFNFILKKYKLVHQIILFVFFFYFFVVFQFTLTAALLTISGFCLVFNYFETKKRFSIIFGALLFVVAALYRVEMFALLFILGILYLLIIYDYKTVIKQAIFLILPIILIFSFEMYNKSVYKIDSQWSCFFEYNKVRGELNDNIQLKSYLVEIENDKNFNKNDLIATSLFINHFISSEEMNLNRLNDLKKSSQSGYLKKSLVSIFTQVFHHKLFLLFLVLFSFYLLIPKKSVYINLLFIVISFLFVFIMKDKYLKARIYVPILIMTFLFLMQFIKCNKVYSKPLYFILILSSFLLFYIYGGFDGNTKNYVIPIKNKLVVNFDYFDDSFSLVKNKSISNYIFYGWLTNFPPMINKIEDKQNIKLAKHFSPLDEEQLYDKTLYRYSDNNKNAILNYLETKKLNYTIIDKNNNLFVIKQQNCN